MNTQVDLYFIDGCGRCPLGGTPNCKVHTWVEELMQLRAIIIDCGLTEESKWGVPCYTLQNNNIVLISAFNEHCVISFFKGALLSDSNNLLVKPGENSQSVRIVKFNNVQDIVENQHLLKAYIYEAIEVEKAGLKVDFKQKTALVYPDELKKKLAEMPALKAAFAALTPGRQRGYNLYFSQPKQSKTRESRIEKYINQILEGKGFHD